MAEFQAFLVITLLTWAAVSVSGTTPELSTTTGDTVNIPCLFGVGTLRSIYWYYNDGTGPQKILALIKGDLIIKAEYANRARLQNDNSTLILNDITVADQGTYQCDVDRQGKTAVPNINTKLNVFSLRPDTLPMILPCTGADESSSCSIHANQSFTLTCTLPNVYPVEDTELIWYQDRKRVSSTDDVTQNDDGTTNIRRQIQISETGNFTCNATYHSANGRENTAVSVEAWIILSLDVPNTPGKNMTSCQIAGMIIGILFALIVISLVIILFYRRSKTPAESANPTEGTTEKFLPNKEVDNATLRPSPTMTQGRNVNRSDGRTITDEEIIKLSKLMPGDKYFLNNFCVALGININYSNNIKAKHQLNYSAAFQEILINWSTETRGFTQDLDEALVKAELGGLRYMYNIAN